MSRVGTGSVMVTRHPPGIPVMTRHDHVTTSTTTTTTPPPPHHTTTTHLNHHPRGRENVRGRREGTTRGDDARWGTRRADARGEHEGTSSRRRKESQPPPSTTTSTTPHHTTTTIHHTSTTTIIHQPPHTSTTTTPQPHQPRMRGRGVARHETGGRGREMGGRGDTMGDVRRGRKTGGREMGTRGRALCVLASPPSCVPLTYNYIYYNYILNL